MHIVANDIQCFSGWKCAVREEFNKFLEDLDYASDIYLLSGNTKDMQEKVNALQQEAEKVDLIININKINLLCCK